MEAYPAEYVEHNLPLILISGLVEDHSKSQLPLPAKRQGTGVRLVTEAPLCQAEHLLGALETFQGSDQPWNALSLPGPTGVLRYKIKAVGRTYELPARKAAPLPQSPGADGAPQGRNAELHSPFSPLSPGSPVFPDGILAPNWFAKHQEQIPSIFLAVFAIQAGAAAAQDDLIKSDINAVRSALARSGFKTRFAALVVGDKSVLQAPELEERLASIRRSTGLDARSGLFFVPPMSTQAETITFVQTIFTTLQPLCVEYYRELTKHARRKKARGGPTPQATLTSMGTSQTTSQSGWNVRYEIKQGVFAEFRQEMDVAERHYSAAIEELFSSEGGVFETTVNWSPRWDEARLLCDAMALRVIRCQLWIGITSGAVQSWQNYRTNMRHLIDQRGKGSLTYGWDAWEARWAGVMSQLINASNTAELVRPPAIEKDVSSLTASYAVYASLDRSFSETEPFSPFQLLHHSGYWLRLMAQGIRMRWEKALNIPEEDRVPPGQSPASAVVHRAKNYDTYLVLEPHEEIPLSGATGYDYAGELKKVRLAAIDEFDGRRQQRLSQQTQLELAHDLVRAGTLDEAIKILRQLWGSAFWRQEEWTVPFVELTHLLLQCINQNKLSEHASLVPELIWELSATSNRISEGPIVPDLATCLQDWSIETSITLQLGSGTRLCPFTACFAFLHAQSHVGESVGCQLTLTYNASTASASILLHSIQADFGSSQKINIKHKSSAGQQASPEVTIVPSSDRGTESDDMYADLRFTPQHVHHIQFLLPLREAQIVRLTGVNLHVDEDGFKLTHRLDDSSIHTSQYWHLADQGKSDKFLVPHLDTRSLEVMPKPPKLEIVIYDLMDQYYADDMLNLSIEIFNLETDTIHASLAAEVMGLAGETLPTAWNDWASRATVLQIKDIPAASSVKHNLLVRAPTSASSFTLRIDASYVMLNDTDTPLMKAQEIELTFVLPLSAKFAFGALFHSAPWPNYFSVPDGGAEGASDGIVQLWNLGCQLTSKAVVPIRIKKCQMLVLSVEGDASCNVHAKDEPSGDALVPGQGAAATFEITTQKMSLDERRSTHMNLSLLVTWSREDSSTEAITAIQVPRLSVSASEPRVLCTAGEDVSADGRFALCYTLENPSTHFLTFTVTMEANEHFAFSGPKYRTLSLAPFSRFQVEYQIVLHEWPVGEDIWVNPNLQVLDSYYQKNLKIHPASKRVHLDDQGAIKVCIDSVTP